jgi:lipopolysaccharide transport system permease protein
LISIWRRTHTLVKLGWLLFLRDFRTRFRQTYFGPIWAVAQVLLSYLPVVLVGSQLGLAGGKEPVMYALHALFGLIVWQTFWDGLYMPQWVARRLRGIMSEVPFPLDAVLVAACSYALFNTTIYLTLILLAFAVTTSLPPASFVLGVIALPFVIMTGLAVGVFLVPVTFIYLDFRYGLPLLAPALLWTAPILYDTPPAGPVHWLNRVNPLTYLINAPRDWLATGWRLEDAAFLITLAAGLALLAVGLRFYHHAMPRALECLPRR